MFKRVTHVVAAAALGVLFMGTQCPSIPTIETRMVDLSLYATAIQEFESVGEINVHEDSGTLDLNEEIDFAQVLIDADIDIDQVKSARLAGISVKRVRPDPAPDRAVTDATVTIQRGSGSVVTVVSGFSMTVNDVTDWETVVPDDGDTADLINGMLDDIIAALRVGATPTDMEVTWTVDGDSTPSDEATDFSWQIKLDIAIVGEFEVDTWG